jgi:V/A-type H+-transporting ATPase subunit F
MKFFVISDNNDTLTGLRLSGIEGVVIHTEAELKTVLNSCIAKPEIAIVLMTTQIVNLAPAYISELKLKLHHPLLTEIPDRFGSANLGETIDSYISEAIGIKLKGD